jgi:large subunit ribosomal protein L13
MNARMTRFVPREEIKRDWYLVDAEGETLGRLSSRIARVLVGKHRPDYTPNSDNGDHVIVINAEKVRATGAKFEKKLYKHHTLYPGGLKTATYKDVQAKDPARIIEMAVGGMMPGNKLHARRVVRLKVYKGGEHPHEAQMPKPFSSIKF